MTLSLVTIHPFDPWGSKIGGIETAIRTMLQHAPADCVLSLVGVTENPHVRLPGVGSKWTIRAEKSISSRFFLSNNQTANGDPSVFAFLPSDALPSPGFNREYRYLSSNRTTGFHHNPARASALCIHAILAKSLELLRKCAGVSCPDYTGGWKPVPCAKRGGCSLSAARASNTFIVLILKK
jgi:hypothetical protein